ncbi:MAG: YfiR family protein, partial [Planctomycetes bacterium]|nr:YfiR family protein [Planctomycetota bacterium]
MTNKSHRICLWVIMGILAAGGWTLMASGASRQDKKQPTEYELKAVCIYNFLKYTEWPKDTGPLGPIVIGVVGKDPFGKAWKQIEGKKINNRPIVVKTFGDFNKINTVQENNRIKYTYD